MASSSSQSTSIHGPALSGWQFHQSHGQVTVVFYVSLTAREEDLSILIGPTYVVAGVKGGYEPVLKASTYARIDPAQSSWQLERSAPSQKRTRPRTSASGSGSASASGSGSESKAGANQKQIRSQRSSAPRSTRYYRRAPSAQESSQPPSITSSGSRSSLVLLDSRPASPAPSSSESFDVLQQSTDSLRASSTSSAHASSSSSSPSEADHFLNITHRRQDSPPDSAATVAPETASAPLHASLPSSPHSSNSPSSSRASFPSPESDEGDAASKSAQQGVRSMHSSFHLSSSNNNSSQPSSNAGDDQHPLLAARLVTIHLTKIDAGMWPSLISGPAPAHLTNDDDMDQGESLLHTPSNSRHSFQSDDDSGTILDDSGTLLGLRGRGADALNDEDEDETRYNMDPISLVLMGLQIRSSSVTSPPLRRHGYDEAFEYFARSWRKADLPVAARLLVQAYLPVIRDQEDGEQQRQDVALANSARPRMIAALGGHKALARLYVSYARLSLSTSSAHQAHPHRSYLFPSGPGHSRDPYSGILLHGAGEDYSVSSPTSAHSPSSNPPSSPPSRGRGRRHDHHHLHGHGHSSEAHYTLHFGPLAYLEAARKLDPQITIEQEEWTEARAIHDAAQAEAEAEEANLETSEELSHSGYFGSNSGYGDEGEEDQAEIEKRRERKRNRKRARARKANDQHADGGVVVLKSAILVSFVVAGGVAVLGWWKKRSID